MSEYEGHGPETERQQALHWLMRLRDEYTADIPAEFVRLGDVNYHKRKCRNNWFHSVLGWAEMALDGNVLPEALSGEYAEFVRHAEWIAAHRELPRTAEEIAMGDVLITHILEFYKARS